MRAHLRERLLRLELDSQRDHPLGQLRLRAAHARRDRGEGGRRRPAHGSSVTARRQGRVRAGDRPRLGRGLAARSRFGVRDAGGGGRARGADGDPARGARGRPRGQGRGLGRSEAQARALGGRGGDRDAHPRAEHAVGYGHAGCIRPTGGRKDGHQRGARGRLVRRIHARARDDRLDGLYASRDSDGERARDLGQRRKLPGRDLAVVHGAGAGRHRARGVLRAGRLAGMEGPSRVASTH